MESEKPKVTLYDFLYIDRERIKSLYAQIFGGLLNAVQQAEASSNTSKDAVEFSAVKVVTIGTDEQKTVTESRLENIDPHDLLLRDVLQHVAEHGLIASDPAKAAVGSLVLLNGSVTVLDMRSISTFFDIFIDMVAIGKAPNPEWAGKGKEEKKRTFSMIKKYLDAAALGVQIIFRSGRISVWGTLNPTYLRESVGDLTTKHGPRLSGEWHLLAIVDSVGPHEVMDGTGLSDLLKAVITGNNEMIKILGRPADNTGVTPLVLFRKLQLGN